MLGNYSADAPGGNSSAPQLKSSSDLLQLRQVAQDRIIDEMLSTVKHNCTLSPDYVVLILDKFTAHLFTSLNINFYELYRFQVFQVEELAKQRKRYPMSDAIYFIEPSRESVAAILKDFPMHDSISYD